MGGLRISTAIVILAAAVGTFVPTASAEVCWTPEQGTDRISFTVDCMRRTEGDVFDVLCEGGCGYGGVDGECIYRYGVKDSCY